MWSFFFFFNCHVKLFLKIILPNKKIKIIFDKSKPNGTPRKLLDIKLAKKCGWVFKTKLKDALLKTFKDYSFQKNKKNI